MSDLSSRKRDILRAIVFEYVSTAEPVASELVARKYELGVRSATIRNEMAEITELGLLEQPHTSAGRIPSDTGYRFYVDNLRSPRAANPDERQTLQTAHRDEDTLRELVHASTKSLSRLTRLMSAALTVRDANIRVRNTIVTALGPDRALLVIVLENGHTENRVLDCPPNLTLQHIGAANEALAALLDGQTLADIPGVKSPEPSDPALRALLANVLQAARSTATDLIRGHMVVEGEEFVLAQPEFVRDPETMDTLADALSDEDLLRSEIVNLKSDKETVTIGREHTADPHRALAIIRQPFFVGEKEAGVIAIIGPTRMDYDRNISLLDYTANAISQTLTRLFP